MSPALPSGPYDLLLADPPWAFRAYNGRDRTPTRLTDKDTGQQIDHYPTMTIAEMKAIPVPDIVAKNSLLAMWVVGSHCDAALELAGAWGFAFVTDLFYWLKQKLVAADQVDLFTGDIAEPKISMGYHTRKQLEPCYLFARGKGLPVQAHDVRQLIIAPPSAHSRKPAEQYDRLERLYGDTCAQAAAGGRATRPLRRLELFARNTRQGWDSWGNEVGKFDSTRSGKGKAA